MAQINNSKVIETHPSNSNLLIMFTQVACQQTPEMLESKNTWGLAVASMGILICTLFSSTVTFLRHFEKIENKIFDMQLITINDYTIKMHIPKQVYQDFKNRVLSSPCWNPDEDSILDEFGKMVKAKIEGKSYEYGSKQEDSLDESRSEEETLEDKKLKFLKAESLTQVAFELLMGS